MSLELHNKSCYKHEEVVISWGKVTLHGYKGYPLISEPIQRTQIYEVNMRKFVLKFVKILRLFKYMY